MRAHHRYFHKIPELDVPRILAANDGNDDDEDEDEEEQEEHRHDDEEEEEEPVSTVPRK